MYESLIEAVIPRLISMDDLFKESMANGKGIIIDSVESYNKKGEKIVNGLQSPFFGSDFDDSESNEKWACKCKRLKGLSLSGVICEKCGTPVEYVDTDISKKGWVILNYFKIINPIFCAKINEFFGNINSESVLLDKILRVEFGNKKSAKDIELEKKKVPYLGIGLIQFRNNYREIIKTYGAQKKGKKIELYKELLANDSIVFTNHIPIVSSVLRIEVPGEKNKKEYKLKINTIYRRIINICNKVNEYGDPKYLKERELISINKYLHAIQKCIFSIFLEYFSMLDGKTGIINGKVMAGRYNYSARNVIVPSTKFLKADEMELCYISFLELFRYELCNLYSKTTGCSIQETNHAWKRAKNRFDPVFYDIMEYIVKEKTYVNLLINRNPSINVGAFLGMRVVHVKKNIEDKTLTIPTSILITQNADFDGDMMNIFRIIGVDFNNKFMKAMNPRYTLYINYINGRINKELMPSKDELASFWAFNNR